MTTGRDGSAKLAGAGGQALPISPIELRVTRYHRWPQEGNAGMQAGFQIHSFAIRTHPHLFPGPVTFRDQEDERDGE
jgi:hypothetical protein